MNRWINAWMKDRLMDECIDERKRAWLELYGKFCGCLCSTRLILTGINGTPQYYFIIRKPFKCKINLPPCHHNFPANKMFANIAMCCTLLKCDLNTLKMN